MILRVERPGDEAAIAALVTAAFDGAPHASGTEAAIVARLRAAGALTLSLVAEADGVIVGHVAFSPVTIGDAKGWYGLGPVAAEPARQRQGIGSALIEAGTRRLFDAGAAGIVLLGDPRYYRRFGFRASPALTYPGTPHGAFMALPRPGGTVPAGVAAYHPSFDD